MNIRKIVKAFIPKGWFRRIEPWGHLGEAVLFNIIYGFPARGLKVIGATGTNGKTTTAFLIHKMLTEAGYKAGLMTTVAWGTGDNIKPQGEHMTTVPVPLLLSRIKSLKAEGVEWLVMETTSHALAQNRVWGIPYSVAVLTNISHEHLDYHGTMENYTNAKLKLFKLVSRNRKGLRTGVINADDKTAGKFKSAVPNVITYGLKAGDLKASNLKQSPSGSEFTADGMHLKINLPGEFNIYNALAAAGAGRALGLNNQQIEKGLASLEGVPGRMQAVQEGQDFSVVIDYAVTPDALEKALKTLRKVTKGKIMLVFGSTGDRDKLKRPIMGAVAAKNADKIYLTDDETYTEDPAAIRAAVFDGIRRAGGTSKTQEIGDREEAIKAAVSAAKAGDTVVLTGMGHQKDRNMGGKLEPWDEAEIAKKALKKSLSY